LEIISSSITGPPVNLAITPDQHLALVANSLDWVKDGDAWKGVPDNKIYVIDLTASPPGQIGTVETGKQASGMAINRAGTLALVLMGRSAFGGWSREVRRGGVVDEQAGVQPP
jgi:hypothetical protein